MVLFVIEKIDAVKNFLSALADRRYEKGVSSLQEPPGASISARKPLFRTAVRETKCNYVEVQERKN